MDLATRRLPLLEEDATAAQMFEEALPVRGDKACAEGLGAEAEVFRDAGHVRRVDADESVGPRAAVSAAAAAKFEGEGTRITRHRGECSAERPRRGRPLVVERLSCRR